MMTDESVIKCDFEVHRVAGGQHNIRQLHKQFNSVPISQNHHLYQTTSLKVTRDIIKKNAHPAPYL